MLGFEPISTREISGYLSTDADLYLPVRLKTTARVDLLIVKAVTYRWSAAAYTDAGPVTLRPTTDNLIAFEVDRKLASQRVLLHEREVAARLNSLIRLKQLVRTGDCIFELGYVPATASDWSPGLPVTIGEALDRISAALAALGQKP